MNDNITITIGNKKFSGWTSLQITQGLDQLAPSFSMAYTDRYSEQQPVSFYMGQECVVSIENHRLVTGHIEEIDDNYTATEQTLAVRGRDNLGDLVDCSYWKTNYVNEWDNQTIESLVKILCEPFSIDVVVDSSASDLSTTKHVKFKIKEGDTVADSLVRLSRIYAFLPVGYGDGKITLTRVATDRKAITHLQKGKNILIGRLSYSDIERFSNYVVKGSGTGFDLINLTGITQPKGVAQDDLITRHRPMVLQAEDKVDSGLCQKRAQWESVIRAGKSRQNQYTVADWLQGDGSPWLINSLVDVNDTTGKVKDTLLISKIEYTLSERGKLTQLTLVSPKTYDIIATPEQIDTTFDLSNLNPKVK